MTRLLALLGDPVSHSLSPRIQNAAIQAAGLAGYYVALRTDAVSLPGLLRGIALAGGGGNVTLPHKALAFTVVDRVTAAAQRTRAVNTFWERDGLVWGDNTDVEGLASALQKLPTGAGRIGASTALILGAGGAARAALVSLEMIGIKSLVIRSRRPFQAELLLREIRPAVKAQIEPWDAPHPIDADLVINATPLGLSAADPFPLSPDKVPPSACVMDLVYHPQRTAWVRALAQLGYRAMDGGEMLIGQGRAAFARWWGVEPPETAFEGALETIRRECSTG